MSVQLTQEDTEAGRGRASGVFPILEAAVPYFVRLSQRVRVGFGLIADAEAERLAANKITATRLDNWLILEEGRRLLPETVQPG